MKDLLCKSCGCNYFVSDRKIKLSDNDWFYCPNCGSGNVVFIQQTDGEM